MSEDGELLLQSARINESKKEWAAAVDCLERLRASATEAQRAEIAAMGTRIGFARNASVEVRARAKALVDALGAAAPATRAPAMAPPVSASPPAEPPDVLSRARELLVTPDVVRALQSALGAQPPTGPLALPVVQVVTRLVGCELDLGRTVDLALDLLLEATRARRGFILVRDADGKLSVGRGRGLDRASLPERLSTAVLGEVERTRRPVFLVDAAADTQFGARESVQELGLRSVACVPALDPATGELLGVVYLDDPGAGLFGDRARETLTALGAAIAVPLRNAQRFEAQRAALKRARSGPGASPRTRIAGTSGAIREALALIARAAPEEAPVLVEGESGTGKELAARVLHELSPRRGGPFVAENLAALSPSLVESELFGVTRGAFTGADRDREGLFVRARGGTLFLDEVGELPLDVQAKLLRALQEREVRPLGAANPVKVDARIVAATNRDLGAMVRAGGFREDLLYRLRVVVIRMPPLRERLEDIPVLAETILEKIAATRGEPVTALSADALARLARRRWRGNVRELENVLWRVALAGERAIDEAGVASSDEADPLGLSVTLPGEALDLERARLAFDRVYVKLVLDRHQGSVQRAAEALGITRPSLSRLLKRLGLAAKGGEDA